MHCSKLRQRRRALRLSQEDLAQRLGVTKNTVARWERGELTIARPRMLRVMLDHLADDLRAERARQSPEEHAAQRAHDTRWFAEDAGEDGHGDTV